MYIKLIWYFQFPGLPWKTCSHISQKQVNWYKAYWTIIWGSLRIFSRNKTRTGAGTGWTLSITSQQKKLVVSEYRATKMGMPLLSFSRTRSVASSSSGMDTGFLSLLLQAHWSSTSAMLFRQQLYFHSSFMTHYQKKKLVTSHIFIYLIKRYYYCAVTINVSLILYRDNKNNRYWQNTNYRRLM